jgi:hypothetical protein
MTGMMGSKVSSVGGGGRRSAASGSGEAGVWGPAGARLGVTNGGAGVELAEVWAAAEEEEDEDEEEDEEVGGDWMTTRLRMAFLTCSVFLLSRSRWRLPPMGCRPPAWRAGSKVPE